MMSVEEHPTAHILDIELYGDTRARLVAELTRRLQLKEQAKIGSINPEIALLSQSDEKLRQAIEAADFRIADGTGVALLAGSWRGRCHLIRGRELMLDLLHIAEREGCRVYFLGGGPTTSELAVKKAAALFLHATFRGARGPQLTESAVPVSDRDAEINEQVISEIKAFKPDMLFVAFGAPKQEKWVSNYLKNVPVKLVMVVGGALDYFSGVAAPPPALLAQLGLEWLWRLVRQPKRWRRIVNAVIVFPLRVVKSAVGRRSTPSNKK